MNFEKWYMNFPFLLHKSTKTCLNADKVIAMGIKQKKLVFIFD